MKTDENGMHIEEWPDSGITETSYMPPGWLWLSWIVSAIAFHVAVSNQFWAQTEETPNFGPGWHAVDTAENYPANAEGVRMAHPSPSDAFPGETPSDHYDNRKESEVYWGNFGTRR